MCALIPPAMVGYWMFGVWQSPRFFMRSLQVNVMCHTSLILDVPGNSDTNNTAHKLLAGVCEIVVYGQCMEYSI